MKVNLGTVEFDDDVRKLVAEANGGSGLATRELIRDTYVPNLIKAGNAALETASIEAEGSEGGGKKDKKAKSEKAEKPAKEGKKGKKSKDEPAPEPEAKSKKDKKKGKKGKG